MCISVLVKNVSAAEAAVTSAREALNDALLAKNPYPVGSEFERMGMTYRVRGVSPCRTSKSTTGVWLDCYYWTTAKRWSQSSKTVFVKITDEVVEVA